MKPIIRWTVGPKKYLCDDLILRKSIKNFQLIYGDKFEYFLCFNGRNESEFFDIKNVNFYQQSHIKNMDVPKGVSWKLYPPRLNIKTHEIFIDHDLIIIDKIDKILNFVENKNHFIYSRSLHRNYGQFDSKVKPGFRLNSGLFGVPPNFNFVGIEEIKWDQYFDEQGFVASLLCQQKNLIEIPLSEIMICDGVELTRNVKGYHMVNNGQRENSWISFLKKTVL